MDLAALSLALGAGAVAALNPCGFALLPAYLSLLVVPNADDGRAAAVGRALMATAVMTAGFMVVFLGFGLIVSPVASSAQQYLPWVTVVVGVVVVALGAWLLAGRELPALSPRPKGPVVQRTTRSMFLFGVSYALASLTCTVAPFLAIVVAAFRAGSWSDGTVLFLAYAVGMGGVVGVAACAVAVTNTDLVARLRRTGQWVPRVAGLVLLLVGLYVTYYGVWELRLQSGEGLDDPVVSAALGVQRWSVEQVGRVDAWVWPALALVVVALLIHARRRQGVRSESRRG